MENGIVAAFQTWGSGMSALYCNSETTGQTVEEFIESHYKSATFATLHKFTSVDEAKEAYKSYMELYS